MRVSSACGATWSHFLFCTRYASEAFYGQSSPRSPVKLRELLLQLFEVDRLSLKLAAILARPKQGCDVTGCITLMPR